MRKSKMFFLFIPGLIGSTQAMALANPASVNCTDQGGTLTIEKAANRSEVGFCSFGRGAIEEWTLYTATVVRTTQKAVQAYLEHPPVDVGDEGNPAGRYCLAVGGKTALFTSPDGQALFACEFDDKSTIEAWALFWGPSAPSNAEVTRVLTR